MLELDRVRETAPDDMDGHRLGLKAARKDRLESISRSTERLLLRMDAAATSAILKVLLNPSQSPAVVKSTAHVAAVVKDFHERLGIEDGRGHSRRDDGWRQRPTSGTRRARPVQKVSTPPSGWAARHATVPDR